MRQAGLSVGIPVYNQANTIAQAIESVLCQNVPPLEVVVSDNHSTDGTDRIVNRYADRIRIIKPSHHLDNMMEHFNFLVSQLRGEWFSLLCGDDMVKPNFVTTLLKGIACSRNAVLVRAGFQIMDGGGRPGEQRLLLSVRRREAPPRTLYESLLGPKAAITSVAVRFEAWREVGGFPEQQRLSGDWGLWIRLAPLGEFIYQPVVIGLYRANYRPALQKRRFTQELLDGVYAQTVLIPEAAKGTPRVDERKLFRARRKYLRRAIAVASRAIEHDKRAEICDILLPLAVTPTDRQLLEKFKAGMVIQKIDLLSPLKHAIRNCVSLLFVWFHRRTGAS